MTSGKGVDDRINTLIKKKSKKKGLFNYGQDIVMAFSPLLQVVIVKKGLQKGGATGTPGPPPGYAYAIDIFQIKVMEPYGRIYVWATMHLSLLSHRVGGGRGRPREIWHFHESQSQIPQPWVPLFAQNRS